MTVIDLRDRTGPEPATSWVRDPLASDVDDRLVVHAPAERRRTRTTARAWPLPRRHHGLPVGWPIAAVVAFWPVWWALGLTSLVFPLCGVVLAWQLRRRRVSLPPGFWLWGCFLLLVACSVVALDAALAGTAPSEGVGRYFAFALRFLNYLTVTAMLLFVGNTTEEELPRRRVIRWAGALAVSCILLGTLSLFLPDFEFVPPGSLLLPGALREDGATVALAQFQPVLGDPAPRPSAPFAFTNAWGNTLSLLLVWLVVGWGVLGSSRRRLALWVLLALAAVTLVFSLNRGVWIGLALAVVVVTVRLALRGRLKALGALALAITLGFAALSVSPLGRLVDARLETGHSNEVRGSLLGSAIEAATESPVVGFGSTRKTLGSDASIAIGPSEACPRCGARNIGSTGQLTLLLISQGFMGVALYVGFLLRMLWAFRRDRSVLGIAGGVVITLQLLYAGFYTALSMPLAITFLSIGLLWRNDRLRREAAS